VGEQVLYAEPAVGSQAILLPCIDIFEAGSTPELLVSNVGHFVQRLYNQRCGGFPR